MSGAQVIAFPTGRVGRGERDELRVAAALLAVEAALNAVQRPHRDEGCFDEDLEELVRANHALLDLLEESSARE